MHKTLFTKERGGAAGGRRMNIRINRSSQTPIYLQIKCAIQNLILSGELSPGYKMPAERKLAGELDIHRNTVIKAYGELVDEGYLIVSS